MLSDVSMPKDNLSWVFLVAVAGLAIGGSSLVFANEINAVLIKHDLVLEDIPNEIHQLDEDVKKINKNIVRICTSLDINCID